MMEENENSNEQPDDDFGASLPYQVKLAIKKAQEQLDAGECKPHKQVMKEIKERFLKQ